MSKITYKQILGDVIEGLKSLRTASIDLILTSPPYNIGDARKGGFWTNGKHKGDKAVDYNTHDDNMPPEEYKQWQHTILKECYRLIKNTGAIFYNHKPRIQDGVFDDRKHLVPFPTRQDIIWQRSGGVNFNGSFYLPNTERIYIVAKELWKPDRAYLGMGEVWRFSQETNSKHPAPFPYELAERVVLSGSKLGDTVLDCFGGSGTTGRASLMNGRSTIYIDNDEYWHNESKKEFDKCLNNERLFY